jgi:hypothetical protein
VVPAGLADGVYGVDVRVAGRAHIARGVARGDAGTVFVWVCQVCAADVDAVHAAAIDGAGVADVVDDEGDDVATLEFAMTKPVTSTRLLSAVLMSCRCDWVDVDGCAAWLEGATVSTMYGRVALMVPVLPDASRATMLPAMVLSPSAKRSLVRTLML